MNRKLNNLEQGFVALFTVLIASVTLAMAVGIANIALKQIVLSGSATDANKAFYAADSGVECALYNDLQLDSFTNVSPTISCNGGSFDVLYPQVGFSEFATDFNSDFGTTCATITIDKTDASGAVKLTSRGTNTSCGANTSRTVERVIEVTY